MDTNSYYLHFPFFLQESPPKSIHVSYVTGESAKLKYKSKVLDFDNALKRSHWEKNASLISRTDKMSFGINKNKRKFWLKIKKVDVHDSGIYSFVVNSTVLRLWQLNIQGDINVLLCNVCTHKYYTPALKSVAILKLYMICILPFSVITMLCHHLFDDKTKGICPSFLVFFFLKKKNTPC